MRDSKNFKKWILKWMDSKGWKPQKFQSDAWKEVLKGESGLINAPTGSGKTLSLIPAIVWPSLYNKEKSNHLICLWITPLRSLSQQIKISIEEFLIENNLNIRKFIKLS